MQVPTLRYVIDFFEFTEDEARERYPSLFQRLLERVKPERAQNKRASYARIWWIWGEPRRGLRLAVSSLQRQLVTNFAAKHRVFQFLDAHVSVDHNAYVIALDDAFHMGVLSSRIHVTWMLSAGSTLEDRPLWINSTCFLPFPFPACTDEQKQRIRDLGEALDAHRKQREAEHPDLTITGMYNVLEKLRSGEALTAKEQVIHEHGLVSVSRRSTTTRRRRRRLRLPTSPMSRSERLVALNAER